MSSQYAPDANTPWRTAAVVAVLGLIAWSAWRCIPPQRALFSESQLNRNRVIASQVQLYTEPASITGRYELGENDLLLSPGGVIQYNIAQLDGLLHAIYRAEGPNAAELEIRAEGQGRSVLLLQHRLLPSERILDTLAYVFIYNPKELPPGTERILLSVPRTSPSAVAWQRMGSVSRDLFPALAHVPLNFIYSDAFQPPGWSDSFIMLHAPTRLAFRAPAGRHRLTFEFGYNPSTFADPNAGSDGAEISVRLEAPAHSQVLLKQLLEPSVQAADRELKSARFDLDLATPGLIEIVVTAGPNDNTAWDWLVLRDVRFEPVEQPSETKLP